MNRRLSTWMTALLLATLFSGCADVGTEGQVRRQEIQGGTVDSANTSVVGILIDLGNQQLICSGSLIAPNLVLTAQHCVAELTSQYVICGQSPFGSTYPAGAFHVTTQTVFPQTADGYTSVEAVHVPPGGNDTCGFDIALLQLSENITSTAPIVPRIDEPITTGETYTAVGFGHIGDGSGSGTRRMLGSRQVLCGTGTCSAADGIAAAEFAGTDGTCQGDSGGAALDSQGRVLGALSRGPEGCAGSVYSSVDAWATWMRDVGASAAIDGGYAAAPWVELGISEVPENDPDLDGIINPADNCPDTPNEQQIDGDGDGIGDECDTDVDGDGTPNDLDNCPMFANPEQYDNDGDAFGDVCDQDDDNDGVMDQQDNCQFMPNANQADICFGDPAAPGQPAVDADGQTQQDVVIVQGPDSVHATGSTCAGSLKTEGAFFLLLFPFLRTRRTLRRFERKKRK